ncbi:MAG TPA: WbqC family protein [Prolixibacteraceae bacterium]|nr:WbqC family protein [Prolixibacteraceae bacterium]
MEKVVFTSAYLGSVGYYTVMARSGNVLIEQHDSYHKQTCRNRCRILAANGPLDLVVPVEKNRGCKTLMKDVRIDYTTRWQSIHWRSLFSAYRSSPFFEYYQDYFFPFYQRKVDFLLDFNNELHKLIKELLKLRVEMNLTSGYQRSYENAIDLRELFSPNKANRGEEKMQLVFQPYSQTFADKFSFEPDLSIIDLLFNCGPEAATVLSQNKLVLF